MVLLHAGLPVEKFDPEVLTAFPLYLAKYVPDVGYDSPEKAIRAVQRYQERHPTPPDVRARCGPRVASYTMSSAALHIQLEGGRGILIENLERGNRPHVQVLDDTSPELPPDTLGDELRVAWFFPDGDPMGEGRTRSRSWTWHRREILERMKGLRLTSVQLYPYDVSLYFGDEGHILTVESLYEEDTRARVASWNWWQWRRKPTPAGRPSTWA